MTGSKKDELKRREHSNKAAKKSFISCFASIKACGSRDITRV
jgi:hypothetical protein